ncbi:MAG: hypothetical protein GKS06_07660 [Acidobacteria bacterium]|nr:hypothetical protein [Acidobacteriota bacterium]
MMSRILRVAVCLVVCVGAAPALAQLPGMQIEGQTAPGERDPESVIRDQLDAFNAHAADAMTANLHEQFAWFAVDSNVMTLEMEGRGTFRDSMVQYFRALPSARAELQDVVVAGNFVTTIERAYWVQNGVETSQASLAVYEIRNGLIYRVWYYPAYE